MSETTSSVAPRIVRLYSQECVDLLRQALDKAAVDSEPTLIYHDTRRKEDSDTSSEDESEDSSDDKSSSSSQDGESDHVQQALPSITETDTSTPNDEAPLDSSLSSKKKPTKRQPKLKPKERQQEALVQQMGTPPMLALPLDDVFALHVPSALLVKHERHYNKESCESLLKLAQHMTSPCPVVVLLLRSGRFAGGVLVQEKCLQHRACQRYTVRRGQGKAQSSQDGSRRPKSMGAQLRRQGEVALWQDVKETLQQWKQYLKETPLVLVSCPKTMQKGLLEASEEFFDKSLTRKVPLDVGRPTFESVCAVYEIMMQCVLDKVNLREESKETLVDESSVANDALKNREETSEEATPVVKTFPPLTPLHTFAVEGNFNALEALLESDPDACAELIDHGAGPDYMTALHYAAESASKEVDQGTAAAIVSLLLVSAKANPCVLDSRNRVPFFLASHDKVREAFRRARAELGEECWPWDEARVGSALTDQEVAKKQEKAAEKKRRQRARQREKKAREKAQAEEMEQRRKEEEEKRKQEEDAKRIRDGLAPKQSTGTNVCDFCQTVCKGKRRSQMFQRLDYKYCSSECVQKHKRELMAKAALSRLS